MKEHSDTESLHPRKKAGLFSVIFFIYTLDTFRKGRFWNISNLYKPLDNLKSEILGEKLESLWISHTETCEIKGKKPNICTVLFRLFWANFLVDSILLILSLIPRVVQPFLLGNILRYFSSKTEVSRSEAYWYISFLVFFNFMSTIAYAHYKFSSTITAMKIRIACSTGIYKKILRMGQASQNNALNLISNDLSRFDRTSNYVHYIWGSPLFLISILNLIYYDVGISGIAGVLWFIFYMIFQSYFSHWIGCYRNVIAKKTDMRVKLMDEVLSSISVIKMYAWEKPFSKLVRNSRDTELRIIKKVSYFKGVLYSLQVFFNVLAVFLSLLSMVLLKEEISAPKVFKLIMYYYSFNFVITLMFPLSVTKVTELHQILKRVNEFLTQEEIGESQSSITEGVTEKVILRDLTAIRLSKGIRLNNNGKSSTPTEESLLKENDQNCVLQNINLELKDGMLYGFTGAVGSGKSTLLLAMLGETKNSGYIQVNGTVSYASQEPWFHPGTIRQNILFGLPLDEKRYLEVIRVCALNTDLDMLPEHDRTLVGDCGLSLSGGQKSRINLARAVYKNADIYLFDDPLSSVDVHVAEFVMEHCMLGFLKDKCRILVTHDLKNLRKCDHIMVINSGRLEQPSTLQQLEMDVCNFQKHCVECPTKNQDERKIIIKRPPEVTEKCHEKIATSKQERIKKLDLLTYITRGHHTLVLAFVLLIFVVTQASESSIFLFISYWTYKEENINLYSNMTLIQQMDIASRRYLYLFILAGILGVLLVSAILRSVFYTMMAMKTSESLHNNMLHKVFFANMTFFETVDLGQILTRFAKDLGAVDEILPRTILESCIVVLGIVARILLIGYVNPYLVIVVLAFGALFSQFIRIFVYTSKNMKRIEGKLMGPVLSQVKSTIEGSATIRAARAQETMENEYFRYQNKYISSCYMFCSVSHAFSFAVEFITTIFISIVTISCFFMEERINLNGSKIGLAITQAMAFTTYLQFCIIQCVQANNHLVAAERIQEYEDLPQESVSTTAGEIETSWPNIGNIHFRNVQVRYSEEMEPVLKNLNFKIEAGEKIGIVGRTGGGKSSLIAAILKMADLEGEILVDSRDIIGIPVDIIRSRISVLPQDPVLFSGTLRYNLDPFGTIDDHVLYQTLKKVGWCSSSSKCNDLNDQIVGRGSNLSLGQKQLICLARTILRRNKIILIDEATSNMDNETDRTIQQVIREQFGDCTVLTIAHRLSTVLDYDKIMVIDYGKVIEFASPQALLNDNSSKLYEMLYGKNK